MDGLFDNSENREERHLLEGGSGDSQASFKAHVESPLGSSGHVADDLGHPHSDIPREPSRSSKLQSVRQQLQRFFKRDKPSQAVLDSTGENEDGQEDSGDTRQRSKEREINLTPCQGPIIDANLCFFRINYRPN